MNFKKMNFKGNRKKNDNPFAGQDKRNLWEYITDNKKIVMPIILIAAVGLTVTIALNANKRDAAKDVDESVVTTVAEDGSYVVPEVALEKNAYEDVNALMQTYFNAYASGDMDTIKSIYTGLEATEELRLREVSQYITGIPTIDIYTKPGPVDGSYVAYAYTEVLFEGYDTPLPGMQTMYVCTDENGNLFINGDVVDDRVTEYISNISLQADVVDLNNTVAAQYNDIIEKNEALAQFLSDMSANIQVSVGEALAAIESGADISAVTSEENTDVAEAEQAPAEGEATDTETPQEGEQTEEAPAEETTEEAPAETKQIRAIDVVNVRSSDSETADKIGKTEIGDVYTQLESYDNGWSKIEYQGSTAYVKSEYFEEVTGDEQAAADTEEASNTAETTEEVAESQEAETTDTAETDSESNNSKVSIYAKGKMHVSESVKLRKGQSTDSEALTTIYAGEAIEVKEQYASGWAKIEYNGDTGYIKTEYLMD